MSCCNGKNALSKVISNGSELYGILAFGCFCFPLVGEDSHGRLEGFWANGKWRKREAGFSQSTWGYVYMHLVNFCWAASDVLEVSYFFFTTCVLLFGRLLT
jgi:hypothetical protein